MINHARTDRDSYISNATPTGKSSHATFKQWFRRLKPRRFRNLSVFSIELAATSLTHEVQCPDNPKHRIRKRRLFRQ
jgi:hypothetical protein